MAISPGRAQSLRAAPSWSRSLCGLLLSQKLEQSAAPSESVPADVPMLTAWCTGKGSWCLSGLGAGVLARPMSGELREPEGWALQGGSRCPRSP